MLLRTTKLLVRLSAEEQIPWAVGADTVTVGRLFTLTAVVLLDELLLAPTAVRLTLNPPVGHWLPCARLQVTVNVDPEASAGQRQATR